MRSEALGDAGRAGPGRAGMAWGGAGRGLAGHVVYRLLYFNAKGAVWHGRGHHLSFISLVQNLAFAWFPYSPCFLICMAGLHSRVGKLPATMEAIVPLESQNRFFTIIEFREKPKLVLCRRHRHLCTTTCYARTTHCPHFVPRLPWSSW